jgi:outer membrane lipoprotein SlyB
MITKHTLLAVSVAMCGFMTPLAVMNVSHAQSSRPSAIACDGFARNYAENNSRRGQVLGGAAKGSLLGAGIGAIAGGAGTGAAIGAVVGVIGGGARRSGTSDRMYTLAYQDCMAGRIR